MRLTLLSTALLLVAWQLPAASPELIYIPRGPFHVEGNKLIDATGHPFVLRGTAMPFRTPAQAEVLNAGVFSQLGLRWNMNVLRLQISLAMDAADPTYIDKVMKVVHDANAVQLAVILAPHDEAETNGAATPRMVPFWKKWATAFQAEPLVLFDLYSEPKSSLVPGFVAGTHSAADWRFWQQGGTTTDGNSSPGMQALANTVRAAGAIQVIIAMIPDENPLLAGLDPADLLTDPNVVYEICPLHSDNPTDAERQQHFGIASATIPVLANDWGLQLDKNGAECNFIPTADAAAAALIAADMDFFDAHSISWTSSTFVPGKLIKDNVEFFPTRFEAAWTCGQPATPSPGMGDTVRYHLWSTASDAVIPVNGAAGGLATSPGSVAVAYAEPVLTRATSLNAGNEIRIIDSTGKTHTVPLLFVAPSSINFVVPSDVVPGMAAMSLINADGPNLSGKMLVLPVSPGLFSATGNGRGPVIAFTVDGDLPTYTCDALSCVTTPLTAPTQVRLIGTGFRAAQQKDLTVIVGGRKVPIVFAGVLEEAIGTDQIVISLGPEFAGTQETDILLTVGDLVSNSLRINIR